MSIEYASRGMTSVGQENSQAAFDAAVEHKYFNLSPNVILTADKQLVLSHDDDLNDIYGLNANVRKLTQSQIDKLIIPQRIPSQPTIIYPSTQSFLFFDQFLSRYMPNPEVKILIDTKARFWWFAAKSTAKVVLKFCEHERKSQFCYHTEECLNKHAVRDKALLMYCKEPSCLAQFYSRILFDCNNPFACYYFCHYAKKYGLLSYCNIDFDFNGTYLQCIMNRLLNSMILNQKYGANTVAFDNNYYTLERIKLAKARGYKVFVWGVANLSADVLAMINYTLVSK